MKDHGAYWLVRKKGSRETAPIKAFRDWLGAEIAETNKKFQAFRGKGWNGGRV
jgi:LysR family transcriptional regulator, glycine cleavage system transcriptional activator